MVEIYYSNIWNDWKSGNIQATVLFNGQTGEGQVNTDLYGGFITTDTNYGTSISYSNTSITLSGVGNYSSGTWCPIARSKNTIDLTNYKELIINVKETAGWEYYATNLNSSTTTPVPGETYRKSISLGENIIDISQANGRYYLWVSGTVNTTGKCVIDYIALK